MRVPRRQLFFQSTTAVSFLFGDFFPALPFLGEKGGLPPCFIVNRKCIGACEALPVRVVAKTEEEKKIHITSSRIQYFVFILSLHVQLATSPHTSSTNTFPCLPTCSPFFYIALATFILSMALEGTPRNLPSTAPMQASVTRAWATICLVALTTST